jgi:hypothetical protein
MIYELTGGPMDGEVTQVPDPPWPWLRIVVKDAIPVPTFESIYKGPQKLHTVPIANYRLVRYTDGRLGYLYDSTDQ